MLYTEKIQPVAAAHGAIWESDKMVTMNDLIDEADFAEFFDTGPEIEVKTSYEAPPESSKSDDIDEKLKKLNELVSHPQSSAAADNFWKSDQMVTMDDLLGFDDEEEKPVEEPKQDLTVQNETVQLAVQALEQIKSSSGDNMFNLLEKFLNTHRIEQSKTVTKSPILDELYALKAENDKPIEEEIKIKLEPVSQPVKIAPKPICKLDDMINSNSTRDYRLKRQTNNQAASRSRAKKKRLIQERSEKNDRFERDNPELKKTLNKYEGELHGLKRKLDFYEQRLGTVK